MRSPAADLGAQARAVLAAEAARGRWRAGWAWGLVLGLALIVVATLLGCGACRPAAAVAAPPPPRSWPPPHRPEWVYLNPARDHPDPPVPGVPPEWVGTDPSMRGARCGVGACGGGR